MLTAWYKTPSTVLSRPYLKVLSFLGITPSPSFSHCEAILLEGTEEQTLAGIQVGVGPRIHNLKLTPDIWVIIDVPDWDTYECSKWFDKSPPTRSTRVPRLVAESAVAFINATLTQGGLNPIDMFSESSRTLGDSVGVPVDRSDSVHDLLDLALSFEKSVNVTQKFFQERGFNLG